MQVRPADAPRRFVDAAVERGHAVHVERDLLQPLRLASSRACSESMAVAMAAVGALAGLRMAPAQAGLRARDRRATAASGRARRPRPRRSRMRRSAVNQA